MTFLIWVGGGMIMNKITNIFLYVEGGIFIISKGNRINNPLSIIGLFAILSEVAMTVALGVVNESLQSTFIWFVMLFPIILIIIFFITLNFNAKVLYAPSDFKDETLFIQSLKSSVPEVPSDSKKEKEKGKQIEIEIEKIQNKKFNNKKILLDNKKYLNCEFTQCNIVYKGEGEITLDTCSFNNCSWSFEKYAANTLQFMTMIYTKFGDFGESLVNETFNNIKNGSHPHL